jgi:hypothetical protein
MSRKHLTIGLTLSCVIALGIGRADAGKIPLKGSFSGSYTNTPEVRTHSFGGE